MYYVYVYVCQYDSMTSTLKFGFAIFDRDTVGNAITRILGRQSTHSPSDITTHIGRKSILESNLQNIAIECYWTNMFILDLPIKNGDSP